MALEDSALEDWALEDGALPVVVSGVSVMSDSFFGHPDLRSTIDLPKRTPWQGFVVRRQGFEPRTRWLSSDRHGAAQEK